MFTDGECMRLTRHVAAVPHVLNDLLAVHTTLQDGSLAAGLDGDAPQLGHRDLDTVEFTQSLGAAVSSSPGVEGNIVAVGIFDLCMISWEHFARL